MCVCVCVSMCVIGSVDYKIFIEYSLHRKWILLVVLSAISFVLCHVVNQFHNIGLNGKSCRQKLRAVLSENKNYIPKKKLCMKIKQNLTKLRGRHCYMTLLAIVHHSWYILIRNIQHWNDYNIKELSHGQTT